MFHAINWGYSISGLLVGLLVGFTGVGGGSLMTPLLVLVFGVHPSTAVGTDLLYAGITKITGSAVHSLHNTVDWKVVRRLALGSAPAALLTLLALAHFGQGSKTTSQLITTTLGFALLLTAVTILFRKWLIAHYGRALEKASERDISLLTTGLGVLLGVLVTISSVGAGALGVTALLMLYPNMPTVRLVGSDIAHAVPLTLIAGAGHWYLGSVNIPMLGSLLIGSIPGIMLGSHFASRVPDRFLRSLLAGTLALVGARLAF
jgi:uncharacterized membrane protein YfcA